MTDLEKLLREYEDVRFCHSDPDSARFFFRTKEDRFNFVKRLNELTGIEYMVYNHAGMFKIEVFFKRQG